MDILECEKAVYLRQIDVDDTDNILKWRNSVAVKKNFIYQANLTREGHLEWIETKVKTGKVIQFIIIENDTDKPIGSVYLRDVDHENNKAEYGIFIGEENAKGKGYGTQVAKRIIRYAFEDVGLHRLYLRVFADNGQAIKSYEKAGFKREGLFRDEVFFDGVYRDMVWMAVVNTEDNDL